MKKILIVIDMQNDFIDGALGTKEAEAIVENVKAKIKTYPKGAVFATMDTHGPDYLTTQEGRNLPVEHCIRGTAGWWIRPDIAELLEGARIYEKPTFGSTRPAHQGHAAGGKDKRRRLLLRRRHPRQTRRRPRDHALLPDHRKIDRTKKPGVPF